MTTENAPPSRLLLVDTQFLTVREVAAVLRVSPMTVYRLIHSGVLTSSRIGRSIRITRHSVREFLKEAGQAGGLSEPSPLLTGPGSRSAS